MNFKVFTLDFFTLDFISYLFFLCTITKYMSTYEEWGLASYIQYWTSMPFSSQCNFLCIIWHRKKLFSNFYTFSTQAYIFFVPQQIQIFIGWLYKWNRTLDTYGPHEVIWLIDKLAIKKVKSILQYWWQNLAHINVTKKVVTSILKQHTPLKLHHQCLSSLVSQIYTESLQWLKFTYVLQNESFF